MPTPSRVLYVSSMPGIDLRFIKKLKATDLELRVATLNPNVANEMKNLSIDCINLNPKNLPFDDWNRKGAYGFFERRKRRKIFLENFLPAYRKALNEFKPQIVQAGWLQTDGYLAALAKSGKFVVLPHGADIFYWASENSNSRQKTRAVLSQADLLVCDSQTMLGACQHFLDGRNVATLCFPRGIDRSLFNAGERQHHLTMPIKVIVVQSPT